jgi:hypothetical protein
MFILNLSLFPSTNFSSPLIRTSTLQVVQPASQVVGTIGNVLVEWASGQTRGKLVVARMIQAGGSIPFIFPLLFCQHVKRYRLVLLSKVSSRKEVARDSTSVVVAYFF